MSFQEDSESLWAKLHLTNINKPMILGLVLLFAAVVIASLSCVLQSGALSTTETVSTQASALESVNETYKEVITVHVTGCVENPGVYELDEGSRTNDAVIAAGGFTDDANTEALNLARVISDGEQICVPALTTETDALSSESTSTSSAVVNGVVNINKATAEELETLNGVGASTAQKIIDDRELNGPFSSKEDLKRVSGIGDKKYASLEPYISVG